MIHSPTGNPNPTASDDSVSELGMRGSAVSGSM
jgi:hypothetical protein